MPLDPFIYQNIPYLNPQGLNKNIGKTTLQIMAKRPTGESTQGEMTHGRNDSLAKRLRGETTRYPSRSVKSEINVELMYPSKLDNRGTVFYSKKYNKN